MPRCVPLALLLFVFSLSANANASSLIDRAKAAVSNGTVDPARDLAPIIARLAATRDTSEQDRLMSGIEDLGSYALMLLRSLNVTDEVLDEAIAIANSDTGADQSAIKFRGSLLAQWKATRPAIGNSPAPADAHSSTSPEKERAALELLRKRKERVSPDNLGQAALRGDAEVVAALLDAGIDVNAPLVAGMTALDFATGAGCFDNTDVAAQLATIDVILKRGANVTRTDGGGNTILMGAMDCPLPVIERLIASGAPVNAANAQNFTPLQLAFAKGKWDVADVLVQHGARLSRKAIDELFFEKPTDPKKLAVIQRATKSED